MKIFIGLGNPGMQYAETRHNVGHNAVDLLKKRNDPVEAIKKSYARGYTIKIRGKTAAIFKTNTFMNHSGLAVKKIVDRFGGSLRDYIIIHDDLDIPLGEIKMVCGKGPGGHNGVSSIISELGSRDFVRVRLGIGRQKVDNSYVDFVLSKFMPEELELVDKALLKAAEACEEVVKSSVEKAMTLYNNQKQQ